MQKFIVEDSFWDLFPQAIIGLIIVRDINTTTSIPKEKTEAIARLLDEANREANQYLTSNVISENEIVAQWRDAFRKFKSKKGARSSIENLLKRVLKGNPVSPISPVVDLGNALSLKYGLSTGCEDLSNFVGDFRLCVTEGGDSFLPLGEEAEDPTLPGEVCYRDDAGAICRCWNWRDGQRTAVSDESNYISFIVECVSHEDLAALNKILNEADECFRDLLGATIEVRAIIDRDNPEVIIKS